MEHIKLAHGAGGEVMQGLIKEIVLKNLKSPGNIEVPLEALEDSSVIDDIVFTTDCHTVKPLFFPGGDIGSLSVAGTINDVAVMGAKPIALSLGMVIEEGFPVDDLEKIMKSIGETCEKAGVHVITGDTKTVERGGLEGMVTNTSGIGVRTDLLDKNIETVKQFREFDERWMLDSNLVSGDAIIISGYIGDHGVSLLSFREGYGFESDIQSDVAPLNHLIEKALEVGGVVAMKDPTRGGLANAANEWAHKSQVGIELDEESLPLHPQVKNACEMLGIDPMNIGNEGKVLIGCVKEKADEVVEAIKQLPEGKDARIIGYCKDDIKGVALRTLVGGLRIVDAPAGDPVPRIC